MWLSKKILSTALLLFIMPLSASPLDDLERFRDYYRQRFPNLSLTDYANGIYAIDPIARESWQAIEEFPPYEAGIEQGEKLFHKAFVKTKRTYADCFPNRGIGIAQNYPLWNRDTGKFVTLAKAVNDCRITNGELPLDYEKGEITQILAYLSFTSRGRQIDIRVPEDDPRALAAYRKGKDYYYQRHGQLNFACATCHVQNAGKRLRSEVLSASLGHTANWPAFRFKWGEMGTLHRRFRECLSQIKAEPPPAQSDELRALELFLTFMNNGIPISGPSSRK